MIYPSPTAAPSVETLFVNGVKFDICEVDKAGYDMLLSPRNRFFICVEDNHICGYEIAEKFFQKTNEIRWDLFCKTKGECISLVHEFSNAYDSIIKLNQRAKEKPLLKDSCYKKVHSIRSRMMEIFRTIPA